MLSKDQRSKIRKLIAFWNEDLSTKSLKDLYDLKELHVHVNGNLINNEYWQEYLTKIMHLRCDMLREQFMRDGEFDHDLDIMRIHIN